MPDSGDRDADFGDHDAAISVITMPRFWRSRCGDFRDHDDATRVPNPKFPDLTPIFNILRVPWPERSLPVGAP